MIKKEVRNMEDIKGKFVLDEFNLEEEVSKVEISNEEFNGKVYVITTSDFMTVLTGNEYALYCSLLTISYHNNNAEHPVNYLWETQVNFSNLSEELRLYGGKNKEGIDSIMTRKSIAKLFKSLVDKEVLKKQTVSDGDGQQINRYIIKSAKGKLFTTIEKSLLKTLNKTVKGQVIKTYAYIKAIYESSKRNGIHETRISRPTIASSIGEINKKGEVGKRQLDNVSDYVKILYNLNLVNVTKLIGNDNTGRVISTLRIDKVNTSLKDIPTEKIK